MPLPPSVTAANHLRAAWIATLYKDHRPELADLLQAAPLLLDFPGLWLELPPAFAGIRPAWLEGKLLAAAIASGFPVEWIHIWPPGREGAAAPAPEPAAETERN